MDTFDGVKTLNLQPGERFVPLQLRITAATASTANNGFLPYGSTLSSWTVSAHHGETGTSSTGIIDGTTDTSNTLIVYLRHTTALRAGIYHVTARGTFSISGSTRQLIRQLDFNRVLMRDR